jgi:MGT family glycosyltransferase
MTERRTVLFMPESAYGPTNNCIGIGRTLHGMGHRVVFAAEASWRGRLAPFGFEEQLVDLAPPTPGEEAGAGQFWKDFIRETAPEFRKPTIEQLASFMVPTWQALVDGARYCQNRLLEILDRVRPDVVVEDNVVCFPALLTAGVPYVRIVSCNPLEVRDPGLPPPYSGLPAADPRDWPAFRAEYDRTHRELWAEFDGWVQEQGAPPLPDLEFMHASDVLNLYVYPEAVDYSRHQPLGERWLRLDSSVRTTDASFELPGAFQRRPADAGLCYLSLGSLGSADLDLMKRLVAVLAETPHCYIVSKGPRHDEFELAPNMHGAEFVPQTTILPQVDLVLTHGGNNTTTEAFHFGKPMVVLPLFWDQHDNAQRVAETGFGVRLATYDFADAELREGIDLLLADRPLRDRLARESRRVRERDGVVRAARAIAAA